MAANISPKPTRSAFPGAKGRRGAARALSQSVITVSPVLRLVTLALVLVSFLALFITGEIPVESSAPFFAFWGLALVIPRSPRFWKPWMGTMLVLVFMFVLVQRLLVQYFESVLNLVFFLMIYKCFTLRRSTDCFHAQVLSFFALVATAVVTVSPVFMFIFPVYVFLGASGLFLAALTRAGERAGSDVPAGAGAGVRPGVLKVPGRFFATAGTSSVMVLVLIGFYFVALPHYSFQKLDSPLSRQRSGRSETARSGFSEDVKLGEFKRIVPDPTVVMRAGIDWLGVPPDRAPTNLRLRGVALDTYEGNRWRRTTWSNGSVPTTRTDEILFKVTTLLETRPARLTIYQDPDITMRLFGASYPTRFSFSQNLYLRADRQVGNFQVLSYGGRSSSYANPFVYEVESRLVNEATQEIEAWLRDVEPEERRALAAENQLSWEDQAKFLQLPRDVDRVRRIARLARSVAPGPSKAEKALQTIQYLRSNYTYTLEADPPPDSDPLEAFLFETKRGHCEFFATALVLMLRTEGVPARLVNGFYTTDWDELAQIFVVKQSDAHSWVEAWVDGLGWATLDPTPAASAGSGIYGITERPRVISIWEYLRLQWQRRIIDFSAQDQSRIATAVGAFTGLDSVAVFVGSIRRRLASFSKSPSPVAGPSGAQPDDAMAGLTSRAILIWILFPIVLVAIWAWRRRRRAKTLERRPRIDYLEALLRRLNKLGVSKPQAETPLEFVTSLRSRLTDASGLDWLVGLYYRERYGGVAADAQERDKALQVVAGLALSDRRG